MKENLHLKIHKKMISHDKLYGTTTVGARGQVVIPAEARKDLGLNPGDQLMVMGKFGKALGLIKTEEMESFVKVIMENLSGSGADREVKEYIEKNMAKMFSQGRVSK
jgi:AbrB family looped-hinge helix DNA binding protein